MNQSEYMRTIHKLAIGETTPSVKNKLDCLSTRWWWRRKYERKGKRFITGIPKEISISQRQISEALAGPVAQIIDT